MQGKERFVYRGFRRVEEAEAYIRTKLKVEFPNVNAEVVVRGSEAEPEIIIISDR